MKKFVSAIFLSGIISTVGAQVKTPQSSLAAEVSQKVGLTEIEVEYSRPNKNDRVIFGNLVPYGQLWRTGANKNTTIEFEDDVSVNGQKLRKGEYAIYTKPEKDSWTIYFYSENENWGLPGNWDDSKIAAQTTAKVQHLNQTVETFTISLDDLNYNSATLNFAWDNVKVGVKIETPTHDKVMESINKTMSAEPKHTDYINAANYFYNTQQNIQQAKEWMDMGMKMNPKPAFYQIYQQALIHSDAGDMKGALKLAKDAHQASKAAGNKDYEKMTSELIERLSK